MSMEYIVVFGLDDCSFGFARTWSELGFTICQRHLVTSKESSNRVSCATWSGCTSNLKTMQYIVNLRF